MRMNKYKNRNYILTALSLLFMSCVIFGCTLFDTGTADALKNVPTSTSVSALYNFNDYCYNKSALDELANQILTEQAPSYQKTISGLVSYASSNAGRNGKPITNKDITIKYGRYRFTETSTTYNDLVWLPVYISSNSKGEAILTLYLAGTETIRGTSQQEQGFFTMQGLYLTDPNVAGPSNSYGTSHMRSISLGASTYDATDQEYKTVPYATYSGGSYRLKEDPTITQANCNKFSDFITGEDFVGPLYEDLATPSEMSWQANETFATYASSFITNGMSASYANYCWPNEAYGTPASGSQYYLPGYFNYAQKNKTNYNAWQNDKVWLPSLTEVGNGDQNPGGGDTTNGIWKLTANQRSNKQASWLRTAKTDSQKTTDSYNNKYSAYTMFCLDTEGRISESDVSAQCAIRPAIHLNLSKISSKTTPAVKLPDVVTSEYTGSVQTIDDIPADQRSWYSSSDMTVAFYTDKECSRGIAPVDAGTYYMMVTLNYSSNRRFYGETADTMYKSTVFVIKKKKLDVKWTYNADSTVAEVEYADGTTFYDRDKDKIPKLSFYYKNVMNAGEPYYSYPDVMGSYRAYAYILDEQMFRYNYELVENARSNQFTVGRRTLKLPAFIDSGGVGDVISADRQSLIMQYKGKNFVQIENVSSKMKITVTASPASALEKLVDLGLNEETGVQTYMVEDVGGYTFTVNLTEKETANAKWETSVGESADVNPKSLNLSIEKAVITVTFDGLLSSWDTLTDMSFTLGLVGVQAGENVPMRVYYQPARGGNETLITPDANGKYTIPKGRNVGEYTISATIDGTGQWVAGGHYEMKSAYTQKFTVTQASSSFGQDLVSWQYTINGATTRLNEIGAGNTAGNPVELDFKDDYYQFTLQMEEGRLQQYYYVKAEYSDDTYVKDAGLHHVTVTISAYDHNVSFDTQTYVVYFRIKKTAFNMNGVSWDYTSPYQQMSREYEVLLKNVPNGLTVNYSGNKASATGNYTAEAQFVVSEDYATNYEVPEKMTLSWGIVDNGGVVLSKNDYDTSNVRLQYIHGDKTVVLKWNSVQKKWFDSDNKEFVLTFTYDGLEHELFLEGYGPDLTIGTNHVNNKYTNAGNYTARFDYTGNSAMYNDLEFATLGWTIAKAEINFDNVRWGYIVGENEYDIDFEVNPFTFTRDENGPVKFTVGLINLPQGVTVNYSTTCLTKPNSAAVRGNSFSETGDYRTSFTRAITFSDPSISANYILVNSIPTFIPSFQYWSIEDRKFTVPEYDGTWEEFDARTHDLVALCGMPREELPYFRVEIDFLDGGNNVYKNYEGYDGVPFSAYHAGTYIVRFYELRGDAGAEFPWGSNIEIVVGKEKLQVVWDSKGSIPVARVTGLYVTDMIGTKYTTASEVEVKEQYIKSTDGATFYAEPYLTAEYVNDIQIEMGPNQISPLEFTYWFYQSTSSSRAIPKEDIAFRADTKEFNGSAQTFELLPQWYDYTSYLYYEGDSLTQTAVGKYSIDVSFIKYDSVTKVGDAYWAGTEDDRSTIRLTFEITEPTSIALDYPKLESASATYDGNFHKISIVNLAAMNSYITYEVTYEGMNFGQQLTHKAAGNYTITFSFPSDSIGYWKNSAEANKRDSYTLTYRIIDPSSSTPLTLPKLVNDSMEETGGPITFEIANWESYYNGYCTITEGSLTQTSPGTYTVRITIKDEFPDLKFTNGARWYILTFTITEGESGMPTQLALPVVSSPVREYTGAEMSFIDNWGYLSKYVTIVGADGALIGQGSYIQEEIGEYSFYLHIKDEYGDILPWADGSTDDKLVSFSIVPATVDTSKLGAGADGKVTAPNKDGKDVDFDEYFEYKYFDKDGKEVSEEELVDGEEYTVTVSLKNDPITQDKFNKSFENADEIRQALTTNNSFTFTYDSGTDDNKLLLIIIIAEVAVVVFLMIATGVVLAIQHKVYDTVDDEYDSYEDYEEDD